MKVAFDENVPIGMVKVFQTFAKEKQLQRLFTKRFVIESSIDYNPKPGDRDYSPKDGVPWIKRFAAAGGKVIISGNTKMKTTPHERLALIEENMIVIFFENKWNNMHFFTKCGHLMHWWPIIAKTIQRAKPKSFYHVPLTWTENGKLRKVSNEDQKKLKIIKQMRDGPAKRKERRAKRKTAELSLQPDLFDGLNHKSAAKN